MGWYHDLFVLSILGWEVGRKEPLDLGATPGPNDQPRCLQIVLNAIHSLSILSDRFSVDWKQFFMNCLEIS